jgi:hypothetical protein
MKILAFSAMLTTDVNLDQIYYLINNITINQQMLVAHGGQFVTCSMPYDKFHRGHSIDTSNQILAHLAKRLKLKTYHLYN